VRALGGGAPAIPTPDPDSPRFRRRSSCRPRPLISMSMKKLNRAGVCLAGPLGPRRSRAVRRQPDKIFRASLPSAAVFGHHGRMRATSCRLLACRAASFATIPFRVTWERRDDHTRDRCRCPWECLATAGPVRRRRPRLAAGGTGRGPRIFPPDRRKILETYWQEGRVRACWGGLPAQAAPAVRGEAPPAARTIQEAGRGRPGLRFSFAATAICRLRRAHGAAPPALSMCRVEDLVIQGRRAWFQAWCPRRQEDRGGGRAAFRRDKGRPRD